MSSLLRAAIWGEGWHWKLCENVHETQIWGNILNILEKVCKIPGEKIHEVVIAKDKKTVDDKNDEGSSQIQKIVYRRLTVKTAKRNLRI